MIALVTGGAGFIGSHLVDALVENGVHVRVLDDFSTGRAENLGHSAPALEQIAASINDPQALRAAVEGVDVVFHLAAVPSVPRSVADPLRSHEANATGTLAVFLAAQAAKVHRVIYASSSSVYGDAAAQPAREDATPNPLSPYAVSKAVGEQYAAVFRSLYGIDLVGLRFFNVFGPRQDPKSDYAAVIPKFIARLRAGMPPEIYGDGCQARDFTYVDNVVHAMLLAGRSDDALAGVYNVACGCATSVNTLSDKLNALLGTHIDALHLPTRRGDIKNSCADISRAAAAFGYAPRVSLDEGLQRTVEWYREHVPAE